MRLIDADKIGLTDFEIVMCNGDYKEAFTMLLDKITNQPTAYDIDKVVDELEKATQYIKIDGKPTSVKAIHPAQVIEIVKHGVVADDVCEWKLEDEEANLYVTGCEQRQLIFEGTPKENGYRYCPYCSKKIKVVE